jgi:galactokinase/mevalonate kinase-like predicted kinase
VPRDVLVIALDSLPAAPGAGFASTLARLVASPTSAALLSPLASAAAAAGAGPLVAAAASGDAASGYTVTAVGSSSSSSSSGFFTAPVCFLLKAADTSAVAEAVAADKGASSSASSSSSAAAATEAVVPLEAVYSALLAAGKPLAGVVAPASFRVGACDGSAHAVPASAAPFPSPYTHALPSTSSSSSSPSPSVIHARAYARVGLLGNPSDGYGGKTFAATVANFRAEAWLLPNADPSDATISLFPHPVYDPLRFPNLRHLSTVSGREGYSGGIRLMMAALHRVYLHLTKRGIAFPPAGASGFTLKYHTTVPRQVGLAGSSAILTAFLRAILRHYGYGDESAAAAVGLSRDLLPAFVLAIETEELGITAGLQDRVVQAYEGCVHMDFNPESIKERGHGTYTRLPVSVLPPLFLAYCADPSDSGRIHAPVKQRWLAGDPEVVGGMTTIANLADEARAVSEATPYGGAATAAAAEGVVKEWARLMTRNFDTRRSLFGDPALGRDNLRMIAIARECGSAGKFPGSGGAIVGVVDVAGMLAKGTLVEAGSAAAAAAAGGAQVVPALPAADAAPEVHRAVAAARVAAATDVLRAAYHADGYVFIRLQPHEAPAAGAGYVVEA